jgi:hypothetical protein
MIISYYFYLFRLFAVLLISIIYIDCAKTKAASKTESKPEMGIPFGQMHTNSGVFFDQNFGSKEADKKKPAPKKRSRRFSENDGLNNDAKLNSFSFKTLHEVDLPTQQNEQELSNQNVPEKEASRMTERLIGSLNSKVTSNISSTLL